MANTSPNRLISFRARTLMSSTPRSHPNSLAATQQMSGKATNFSHPYTTARLDREASGKEVERLLLLRRELLNDAIMRGDDTEVKRLQQLGVFDDILLSVGEAGSWETDAQHGDNEWMVKPLPSHLSNPSARVKPLPSLSPEHSDPLNLYSSCSSQSSSQSTKTGNEVFSLSDVREQKDGKQARRLRRKEGREDLHIPSVRLSMLKEGAELATNHLNLKPAGPTAEKSLPLIPPLMRHKTSTASDKAVWSKAAELSGRSALSHNRLIVQLISDIKLLADHQAGMYDPGEPELELLRERVREFKAGWVWRAVEDMFMEAGKV